MCGVGRIVTGGRIINKEVAAMAQPLCPWCNKVPAGKALDYGLVSHGICADCSSRLIRELEISKLNAMWAAPLPDGLGPARGIVAGLIVSGVLWGVLAILWRVL